METIAFERNLETWLNCLKARHMLHMNADDLNLNTSI